MHSQDFYCDLAQKTERPIKVITETATVLAFEHTQPYWTTHVVVIPKTHIGSIATFVENDFNVISDMLIIASRICRDLEMRLGGCRLSTNIGNYQTTKHLHFYIHAGERLRDEDGSPIPKKQD